MILCNLYIDITASHLLLHKSLSKNTQSWGAPTKMLPEAGSIPPSTTRVEDDPVPPATHDIKRNYQHAIKNHGSVNSTASNIVATISISFTSLNTKSLTYAATGHDNTKKDGKSSSGTTPANSQTQYHRTSTRGRPPIRRHSSAASGVGHGGDDDDDDDDMEKRSKSFIPKSVCESFTITIQQPDATEADDTLLSQEGEPQQENVSKVDQTVAFTSRFWAAAKSFLTNDSIVTTAQELSPQIATAPPNMRNCHTFLRSKRVRQ